MCPRSVYAESKTCLVNKEVSNGYMPRKPGVSMYLSLHWRMGLSKRLASAVGNQAVCCKVKHPFSDPKVHTGDLKHYLSDWAVQVGVG